MITTPTDMTT